MEKDVYAVLQLEAEEKEMQKSEAQVSPLSEQTTQAPAGLPSDGLCLPNVPSESQAFAGRGFLQSPYSVLSDMGVILLLSPQINTAQRLLEKGKEAPNPEPERSWFQTKEERKKEKSMLGRFLQKLNMELPSGSAVPLLGLCPK